MKTFGKEPEMLTVMVQGADPDRIRELMTLSIPEGAEAFGMQFEQLRPEYRTKETYREHALGARDDTIGMQYLIPGWKFDNKKPCLVR